MNVQLYIKMPALSNGFCCYTSMKAVPTGRWRVDNGSELLIEVEWKEDKYTYRFFLPDVINVVQKKEFVNEQFLEVEVTGDIQECSR